MKFIESHTTISNTVIELYSTGKGFKTVTHYPATKNSKAETKIKTHRTESAASSKINKSRKVIRELEEKLARIK